MTFREFKAYKIRTAKRYIKGAREALAIGRKARAAWCLEMARIVRLSIGRNVE